MPGGCVLLDFSGVYRMMRTPPGTLVDCRGIEGTSCYCDAEAAEEIARRIASLPLHAVHFLDSGDYHYLTRLWTARIGRPYALVLLDNHHLSAHGVRYLCARSKQFVLITANREHPAFGVHEDNLHILFQEELSLADALVQLKARFGCERLTVQSGGTVNGLFLREKLFDFVDVVVAPVLVGGKDTATLVDGRSLQTRDELSQLGVLRLIEASALRDSYVRLRYQVVG